jgi:hypothetical protein
MLTTGVVATVMKVTSAMGGLAGALCPLEQLANRRERLDAAMR